MNAKLLWAFGLLVPLISSSSITLVLAGSPHTTLKQTQHESFLQPEEPPTPGVGWEVSTTSGSAELALAQHLSNIGAKQYVAWWCPYSHTQKMFFGKQADQLMKDSVIIECDSRGLNAQPKLCKTANISNLPTWIINGSQYIGVKSLHDLAKISDYQGDTNFKYTYRLRLI